MKVKIGNILGSFQSGALSRLANATLPMRTALRLKDILQVAQDALKKYDDERIALCESYIPINEETGNYDIPPEQMPEFQLRADAMLQVEVDMPYEPFTPSQLLSSQSITANDLMILSWLIVSPSVPDLALAKKPADADGFVEDAEKLAVSA